MPAADLSIAKSVSQGPNNTLTLTLTFTLLISNAGPDSAHGATYDDPLPAGFTLTGTPSCATTSGGAVCGTVNSSATDVNGPVTTFPANSSVTVTITGAAAHGATISNTATVAPPSGVTDPNMGNNTSTASGTAMPERLQNFDVN